MFSKTFITIGIVTLAASTAATPAATAATTTTHGKRTPPIKIYFCNKTNWRGRCVERQYTPSVCYNLGTAWNDQMLSAGPELYGACHLYETIYCRGKYVTVYDPGTGNLGAYGMGGKVTSLRCFPWSP